MTHVRIAVVAILASQLCTAAYAAGAGPTLSGSLATSRAPGSGCLCGTSELGGTSRCFVDALCETVADCSSDVDCASGQFCLKSNNCCGVPKCVAGCSSLTCTVAPGHGTCETYEACTRGGAPRDLIGQVKARGFTTSMVRAFASCPSTEHPSINSNTGGGTPACSPVTVKEIEGDATEYVFNPRAGGCEVQTHAEIEKDCSLLKDSNGDPFGLPTGACHVTYIKSRCKGVLHADGITPIHGAADAGWYLATLTRATINDAVRGDMTVIDFPLSFPYGVPYGYGEISLESSSAEALATVVGVEGAALPTSITLEGLRLTVMDPSGRPFAVVGVSTRGKTE